MSNELIRDIRAFAERQRDHPLARPNNSPSPGSDVQALLQAEWSTRPEWVNAEFDASLLVAQALNAEVSPRLVRAERDAVLAQLPIDRWPWEGLKTLGFDGDRETYESLDNSRIDCVLARQRGIPISLAVVLISAARHLGLSAAGLNQPGHFLVLVEDRLIDPFSMTPVQKEPVQEQSVRERAEQSAPLASPLMLMMRMLNNAKLHFRSTGALDRALDMVSLQLAALPKQPELWCEKGDLWASIGGTGGASRAYREALACMEGDHPLRATLESRLMRVSKDQETLH
ncbi:MAG: transglutaminase family protein [Pseudomonadota bacterium]